MLLVVRTREVLFLKDIKYFVYLQENWQLPSVEIFWYTKIRNLLTHQLDSPKRLTSFENYCHKDLSMEGLVSDLYAALTDNMGPCRLPYISKWEVDLGKTLDQPAWNQISLDSSKCCPGEPINCSYIGT